jgi:hypothetical protein
MPNPIKDPRFDAYNRKAIPDFYGGRVPAHSEFCHEVGSLIVGEGVAVYTVPVFEEEQAFPTPVIKQVTTATVEFNTGQGAVVVWFKTGKSYAYPKSRFAPRDEKEIIAMHAVRLAIDDQYREGLANAGNEAVRQMLVEEEKFC